jgi:3-methyl-2-oxobutanoate hydroxymethyltransferase
VTDKPPRYASWTAGKLPLPELLEMKRRGEKIVMVTAYDAPSGRLADAAGVDLILVGDSSGMVVHGRE